MNWTWTQGLSYKYCIYVRTMLGREREIVFSHYKQSSNNNNNYYYYYSSMMSADMNIILSLCVVATRQDKTTNSIVHSKELILVVVARERERERKRERVCVCVCVRRADPCAVWTNTIMLLLRYVFAGEEKVRQMEEESRSKVCYSCPPGRTVLYCTVRTWQCLKKRETWYISISVWIIHCCLYFGPAFCEQQQQQYKSSSEQGKEKPNHCTQIVWWSEFCCRLIRFTSIRFTSIQLNSIQCNSILHRTECVLLCWWNIDIDILRRDNKIYSYTARNWFYWMHTRERERKSVSMCV